jgi:hypothetical protein
VRHVEDGDENEDDQEKIIPFAQMLFAVMFPGEVEQAVRLPIRFFALLFSSWP